MKSRLKKATVLPDAPAVRLTHLAAAAVAAVIALIGGGVLALLT